MTENQSQGTTTCLNCGALLPSFVVFCPACGRALNAAQAPSWASPATPAPEPATPTPTPQLRTYGQPRTYSEPSGYGPVLVYPNGYGYAPVTARRSSTPVFVGLGLIGLALVIVVGALRLYAIGGSHGRPADRQRRPGHDCHDPPEPTELVRRRRHCWKTRARSRIRRGVRSHRPCGADPPPGGDRQAGVRPAAKGYVWRIHVPGLTCHPGRRVNDRSIAAGPVHRQGDGSKRRQRSFPTANPGRWSVHFAFSDDYTAQFATWSGQHVNEYFAIVLDGAVLSVPYIEAAITSGKGKIAGGVSEAEAKDLAVFIRFGELPFPLREVSRTMTPTGSAGGTSGLPPASSIVAPSENTPTDVPSSGRTLGNPSAPVTLDVWEDYQCPACGDFGLMVQPRLIDTYVERGELKIVTHDFIVIDGNIGGHESADAANAALCAADQGKFWTFQDWLFANHGQEGSGAFAAARLIEMGRRAGLDMTMFQTCVEQDSHRADVTAERGLAQAKSVIETPTVFVNGQRTVSFDYATVAAAIDTSLAATSVSPSPPESAGGSVSPSASPTRRPDVGQGDRSSAGASSWSCPRRGASASS